MAWLIRTPKGRVTIYFAALLAFVLGFVIYRQALAAPYVNPFWTNNSPSQESAICDVASRAMVQESTKCGAQCGSEVTVDVRTGELFWDKLLFTMPGVVEDNVFAIRWRSMLSGSTQLGPGMLLSFETTAQYVLLNAGNPNGPSGHAYDVRRPTGRVDRFIWSGTAYASPAGVFDAFTLVSGNGRLTDEWGNKINFDSSGMPATLVDRNGNTDTFTYSAYKLTGLTDDRGKNYTTVLNANNYIAELTNPAGQTWLFEYDLADRPTTITSPATADQPSGSSVTLAWDSLSRLTGITDGRGHSVWAISYVGTTGQVSQIAINGNPINYSYTGGRTDRTDRNGNVHRTYFTDNHVTKTCMVVATVEKYATQHYYSGLFPSYTVLARGNRVDTTYNSEGNLTELRRRTQNTSTNDATDIVESWTYSSPIPASYTDPNGNTWTYGYDSAWNRTAVTHPVVTNPATQTASESWVYNSKGQVTRHTNEEGRNTDYSYYTTGSSRDLLYQIKQDATGLALMWTYTYDSAGNVSTVTDPLGRSTGYTWDSLRRLTQAQAPSPLSYRVQHHYDGNGNLTQTDVENIDKDGNVVSGNQWITTNRTYTNTDDLATLVEEIDASTTRTTSFEYDSNQNLIRLSKAEGNKVKLNYNERDLVSSRITGEGATGASTEEFLYDDNGNLTLVEDGRDNDWTIAYDLFDRRVRGTDPLGNYTAFELDKRSRIATVARKSSADVELQRETYFYDQRGRHWKTSALFKDPTQTYSDAVTVIERLKTGQAKLVTNPRGKDLSYTYDGAGRLTGVVDAMGNSVSYERDAVGNLTGWTVSEKDGTATVTHGYEASYDSINRRLTRVEIDRTNSSNRLSTQMFYDSRSNVVFKIDAQGNPTRTTFDGLNRPIKIERALTVGVSIDDFTSAETSQWGFDKNDRLVSHKDDAGTQTMWAYDALDRVTTMTYPSSTTITYQYDMNGNVTQATDPAGNVVADSFDAANRNTARAVTLSTGFVGTTAETRSYDGANRMIATEDNDYKLEFSYAVIGLQSHIHSETQGYVGATPYAKTVTTTYDANGNKVAESYPTGSALSLSYSWNDIDHLSAISDGTNAIGSYAWIGLRRKTETFQSGAKRTNVYTGFREDVESVRHETSGSATLLRLDYGYNAVHDRTYERFGASGSPGDAFEYDRLRRLTVAWTGSSTPASPSGNPYVAKVQYNMDDDGNRSSTVNTPYGGSAATTTYSTNSLHQYTSVGGTSQAVDANGNVVDDGTHLFIYDYNNHLVQAKLKSDGSVVATWRYDPVGRRVEKNRNGVVERYVLSLWNTFSVFDGSNNWLQNFVWNDELNGIQMLEQRDVLDHDSDGNATEVTRSFYHRNALGSVLEITDMNQAVAVSYRYDPYGKVTIARGGTQQSSDPLGSHWTFAGGFLDEEIGQIDYRARTYSPARGRFLQRDPVGVFTESNLYTYASSQPTVAVDPLGLAPVRTYTGNSRRPGVQITMQPLTCGDTSHWTDNNWTEWHTKFLPVLLDQHEFVHATNMAATYAAMVAGGGLPTTITGTGFGPTKPDARKKAEQDARSRLNRATNNVRDQLHDSEAPLDDPTNPNRLPVAEYPEFATHNPPDRSKGGGIESAWKALDRVEAHRAAAVDNADTDEERAAASGGNKAWSEVVFTTANSVVGMPGRVRVEKSFEDWRQGNRKSCSPFAWVSRCTLTITWPRRLDVHVFYPRPGAREE